MAFVDLYKLLGVAFGASEAEVCKAFRRLSISCHPDKLPPEEKAAGEKQFKRLSSAKDVLTDPKLRARYDAQWRTNQQHSNPKPTPKPEQKQHKPASTQPPRQKKQDFHHPQFTSSKDAGWSEWTSWAGGFNTYRDADSYAFNDDWEREETEQEERDREDEEWQRWNEELDRQEEEDRKAEELKRQAGDRQMSDGCNPWISPPAAEASNVSNGDVEMEDAGPEDVEMMDM